MLSSDLPHGSLLSPRSWYVVLRRATECAASQSGTQRNGGTLFFKALDAAREENALTLLDLPLSYLVNLCRYPFAFHTVVGQDEKKLIVEPDRFIDLKMDFFASHHFLRCKPATHSVVLQVRIESFGKQGCLPI